MLKFFRKSKKIAPVEDPRFISEAKAIRVALWWEQEGQREAALIRERERAIVTIRTHHP